MNLKLASKSDIPINNVTRESPWIFSLVALGIGGVLFALVVIELVFRLVGLDHQPTLWNDRPQRYYAPEKAVTFQDFPHRATKLPGSVRIAVVGDSFAFGPYMQFDDTFPKRLERFLNLNSDQPRVEVINYGMPQYSTSNEIELVKKAIEEQADLVILQITLNDPELKPLRPDGIIQHDNSIVLPEGWLFRHWRSLRYATSLVLNTQSHQQYKNYYLSLYSNKDTWNSFAQSLRTIENLTRRANVALGAVIFPLFGYMVDDYNPFLAIHKKIGRELKRIRTRHLDLAESYRNIPVERLQVLPGTDRHPNEIAHRIAAERILDWLPIFDKLPDAIFPRVTKTERIGPKL